MSPDYYIKLAAIWLKLADMERNFSEKERLRERAIDCLKQAEVKERPTIAQWQSSSVRRSGISKGDTVRDLSEAEVSG